MKVLLFSDLHGHAFKPYAQLLPNGMNSRLQDAVETLDQIRAVAKEEKVDLILFGGDMFHTRGTIHVQTFNAIFEGISKMSLGRMVGLLVGNHDQTSRRGDVHSVYAFGAVATVMDKPGWVKFTTKGEDLHILALPHTPEKDDILVEINEALKNPPGDPAILLGHFGVDGASIGSNLVLIDKHCLSMKDISQFQQAFSQIFLGHYHHPQKLANNVRFIGAPHHHNWGDVGSLRGCWLWVPGETPRFKALPGPTFKKFDLQTIREGVGLKESDIRGCYIRIMCEEFPTDLEQSELRTNVMGTGARVVEFVVLEQSQVASGPVPIFQVGMDFEEMLESYIHSQTDPQLDDEMLFMLGKELLG